MKKKITALSDLIINVLKLSPTFGLSRTDEVEYRNASRALKLVYEPRSEKTGLRGFRPGPTQTRLYSHTR